MAKIGIDFGTAYSMASYRFPDGRIHVCQSRYGPSFDGSNTTPSFVRFNADGSVAKHGAAAYDELVLAPELVVWGVKRLLGKNYQQASRKGELKRFGYRIEEARDGSIDIRIGAIRYKPADVVRMLLQRIKEDCEAPFNPIGAAVDEAVITRPAYFESEAVAELKRAALEPAPGAPPGTPGCFRSVELLTESEAAANAYSRILWSPDDREREKWVMTIDWGVGTLDIVISRMCRDDSGVARVTSVFPAYGDPSFGGFDMDDALVRQVHATLGLAGLTPAAEAGLRRQVEKGKIILSTKPTTEQWIAVAGPRLRLCMARDDESIPPSERAHSWVVLNEVLGSILDRFRSHLRLALERGGLRSSDLRGVILLGEPMYMPCVREALADVFEGNPRILHFLRGIRTPADFPVSPMEAVVRGALMSGPPPPRLLSRSYGFLLDGDVGDILVEEGTPLPKKDQKLSRQAEHIWVHGIPAGDSVAVSLLQVEKTLDGTKYYRKGWYLFAPLARQYAGAYLRVELDVSADEELVLRVADESDSQRPAVEFRLAQHEKHEIPGFTTLQANRMRPLNTNLLQAGYFFEALEIPPRLGRRETILRCQDVQLRCGGEPDLLRQMLKAEEWLTKRREFYEEELLPTLDLIRAGLVRMFGRDVIADMPADGWRTLERVEGALYPANEESSLARRFGKIEDVQRLVEDCQTEEDWAALLPRLLKAMGQGGLLGDSGAGDSLMAILRRALESSSGQSVVEPGQEDFAYYDGVCDRTSETGRREYEAALEAYATIYQAPAPDESHLYSLGMVFIRYGDYRKSLACFEKLCLLWPDNGAPWNNRAWCCLRLSHYEEALGHCEKALALLGEHSHVHHDHAAILTGLQRYEEALAAIARGMTHKPVAPQLVYLWATLLERMGDTAAAVRKWDEFVGQARVIRGHEKAVGRACDRARKLGVVFPTYQQPMAAVERVVLNEVREKAASVAKSMAHLGGRTSLPDPEVLFEEMCAILKAVPFVQNADELCGGWKAAHEAGTPAQAILRGFLSELKKLAESDAWLMFQRSR